MKVRIFLGLTMALMFSTPVWSEEPAPDWWRTQREVSELLSEGKRDLIELVKEVRARRSSSASESMTKLDILLRAGLEQSAIQAIRELEEFSPRLAAHQVSLIYHQLCDSYEAWEVARRLLEVFEDVVSDLSVQGRLISRP